MKLTDAIQSIERRKREPVLRRRRRSTVFEQGDRVRETSCDWSGRVVRKGVEVSEVKRDDGATRFVANEYLEREDGRTPDQGSPSSPVVSRVRI